MRSRTRRRLGAAVAALALAATACAPPPPSLGGSPTADVVAERVVRYNGQARCVASLALQLVLNDNRSMTIHSEVIVRGAGIPEAGLVPCAYPAWVFHATLACSDITAGGCGDALVPTPNGDVTVATSTFAFPHPPDWGALRLDFAGTWLGTISDVVPGTVRTIRCDPPTVGRRCLFQPNN